ncbi:unnamed protein product [Dovyalis caffra]|uniref:Uncharacterized protein n=1 Tax=Dovyalis caffra TaxID=77055 RepID=A0AAV1QQZ0_9ROSI|nr:unnamed protein product [Dovyalis caffra]
MGVKTSNGLRMYPTTTLGEHDHFTNSKMLNSSSSSCSSSSGDLLELDANEISKSYIGDIRVPKHSKNTQFALEDRDDDIIINSMPRQEQQSSPTQTSSLNNDSTTRFPPTQVMERPVDSNPFDYYRIMSTVFSRTKSTTPME